MFILFATTLLVFMMAFSSLLVTSTQVMSCQGVSLSSSLRLRAFLMLEPSTLSPAFLPPLLSRRFPWSICPMLIPLLVSPRFLMKPQKYSTQSSWKRLVISVDYKEQQMNKPTSSQIIQAVIDVILAIGTALLAIFK